MPTELTIVEQNIKNIKTLAKDLIGTIVPSARYRLGDYSAAEITALNEVKELVKQMEASLKISAFMAKDLTEESEQDAEYQAFLQRQYNHLLQDINSKKEQIANILKPNTTIEKILPILQKMCDQYEVIASAIMFPDVHIVSKAKLPDISSNYSVEKVADPRENSKGIFAFTYRDKNAPLKITAERFTNTDQVKLVIKVNLLNASPYIAANDMKRIVDFVCHEMKGKESMQIDIDAGDQNNKDNAIIAVKKALQSELDYNFNQKNVDLSEERRLMLEVANEQLQEFIGAAIPKNVKEFYALIDRFRDNPKIVQGVVKGMAKQNGGQDLILLAYKTAKADLQPVIGRAINADAELKNELTPKMSSGIPDANTISIYGSQEEGANLESLLGEIQTLNLEKQSAIVEKSKQLLNSLLVLDGNDKAPYESFIARSLEAQEKYTNTVGISPLHIGGNKKDRAEAVKEMKHIARDILKMHSTIESIGDTATKITFNALSKESVDRTFNAITKRSKDLIEIINDDKSGFGRLFLKSSSSLNVEKSVTEIKTVAGEMQAAIKGLILWAQMEPSPTQYEFSQRCAYLKREFARRLHEVTAKVENVEGGKICRVLAADMLEKYDIAVSAITGGKAERVRLEAKNTTSFTFTAKDGKTVLYQSKVEGSTFQFSVEAKHGIVKLGTMPKQGDAHIKAIKETAVLLAKVISPGMLIRITGIDAKEVADILTGKYQRNVQTRNNDKSAFQVADIKDPVIEEREEQVIAAEDIATGLPTSKDELLQTVKMLTHSIDTRLLDAYISKVISSQDQGGAQFLAQTILTVDEKAYQIIAKSISRLDSSKQEQINTEVVKIKNIDDNLRAVRNGKVLKVKKFLDELSVAVNSSPETKILKLAKELEAALAYTREAVLLPKLTSAISRYKDNSVFFNFPFGKAGRERKTAIQEIKEIFAILSSSSRIDEIIEKVPTNSCAASEASSSYAQLYLHPDIGVEAGVEAGVENLNHEDFASVFKDFEEQDNAEQENPLPPHEAEAVNGVDQQPPHVVEAADGADPQPSIRHRHRHHHHHHAVEAEDDVNQQPPHADEAADDVDQHLESPTA